MIQKTAAAAAAAVPLYSYSLGGRTLYVPITCWCNSRTLPETRGPGFMLPSHIVASLCRFRDLETQSQTWSHWCNWLDWQDTQQHLPERPSSLVAVGAQVDYNEDIEQLLKTEIQVQLQKPYNAKAVHSDHPECYYTELRFGGEGEPTLNLRLLESLSRTFRDQIPNIVVMTNGLLPTVTTTTTTSTTMCVPSSLKEWGVTGVSIAFPTHDPNQYKLFMEPTTVPHAGGGGSTNDNDNAHERLCSFIQAALACNLHVELTAIDRPEVNQGKTQELATQLGVPNEVRWRPYFP